MFDAGARSPDRRRLLKRGLLGGALLFVAGALPLALRSTLVRAKPKRPLLILSEEEHAIFAAVAARVAPGDGAGPTWPTAEALDCAGKVDALMATVHPGMSAEFRQLLRLFDSALFGLAFAGSPTPFTRCAPAAQDARLEAWRHSRLALLRSGYQALTRLVKATYYSSPAVYPLLGYAGPPRGPARSRVTMPDGRTRTGRVLTGETLPQMSAVEVDFCVVGSGAGGSIAAATLAQAGARVAIVEAGAHHTKRDFNMQEAWAYPALYQESGNRATDDLSILILQGRSVGGGTTVNWASSFRTPEATLRLWAERHGVRGLDAATLAPHFEAVEQRFSIANGNEDDVNANNRKLWEGAARLGWKPELIRRSVKGCARLGACGLGCPLDAKQSALVTYIPDALAAGADLYTDCRAHLVETNRGRVRAVVADVLDRGTERPRGRLVVHARRGVLLAGGAINTPALLLRSKAGTGSGVVGKRTFLHPTVPLAAFYDDPIEGFYGPPQSVSVHHFAQRGDDVGYFFETAPTHPMLATIAFPGTGDAHRRIAERLAHVQATIALLIDGHHDDAGGTVRVDGDGRIKLHYPLAPALRQAALHALANMARLQLAAGAREVMTLHDAPLTLRTEADVARLSDAPFGPNLHTLFSAHQMGGCPMGEDPTRSVVSSRGRHHELDNLWIVDGSIFPTSVGVNPQLSIYAHARLFATEIANTFKASPPA